jgi:hypothetical protein
MFLDHDEYVSQSCSEKQQEFGTLYAFFVQISVEIPDHFDGCSIDP